MRKKLIKGASIGLGFSGVAYGVVSFIGYRWTSLTILMYMYVALSIALVIGYEIGVLEHGLRKWLDRFVVVLEEEEMKMKKIASGEKFKVKGEVERLQ